MIQSTLYSLIVSLRPKQRIKNSIIAIPLIFSGMIDSLGPSLRILWTIGLFCLFAGATYIINDYRDRHTDKYHPRKKTRPIASGKLHPYTGICSALLLLSIIPIVIGHTINLSTALLYIGYAVNTLTYSYLLKQYALIDIFSISLGFILRGAIGVCAIHTERSPRLFVILFFGSLLLGVYKRYQERLHCDATHSTLRSSIKNITVQTRESYITILTAAVLIAYTMYTFQSTQSQRLICTIPCVTYGIMRYQYIIYSQRNYTDNLEYIFFKDKSLQITVLIYIAICLCIAIWAPTA